jgi:hypothetical protein
MEDDLPVVEPDRRARRGPCGRLNSLGTRSGGNSSNVARIVKLAAFWRDRKHVAVVGDVTSNTYYDWFLDNDYIALRIWAEPFVAK